MVQTDDYYRTLLREELAKRSERNPRYSQRAFARALGLNAGAFSQFMSGKQVPSYAVTQIILKQLALDPTEEQRFLDSVVKAQKRRALKRMSPVFRKWQTEVRPAELTLDLFRVIADPIHYAILDLTYVEGFQSDPKWIAKILNATLTEAQVAIQRLLQLGLLVEGADGQWTKAQDHVITSDRAVTSAALRLHQKRILSRASAALEEIPIERRVAFSSTMSVNSEKVSLVREMIEEFTRTVVEAVNTGPQTDVYDLSISFFPFTRNTQEK